MKFERWMLETREAGTTISRAFFSSEQQAKDDAQDRRDKHIGLPRAYIITRQEIDLG